jgi:nicotinate phosphoribosyltransferase
MGAGHFDDLALYCDEYELTMADSFVRHGQSDELVSFELSVRHLPANRGCLVVAGLAQAVEYLRNLQFTDEQCGFLRDQRAISEPAIAELSRLRFSGDVDAIPEGTCVGAGVPLLRVVARRVEATIVESALLALINHQTMVASKAARIVTAAGSRGVWDYSLRRLHGPQAAPEVARAAYIAGCSGTATVEAAARYGVPTTGPMAHHYVMAFGADGEERAFVQFLRDFPDRGVLLVDTFDSHRGIKHAIAASRETGISPRGVRLDSGDFGAIAHDARAMLDAAGLSGTAIVASGDLDEWRIADLVAAGAPIDSFGVGTKLGTSFDAPALGGVYKLVAQGGDDGGAHPGLKRSTFKSTDPGQHQVYRHRDCDEIALLGEHRDGEPMLHPVLRHGGLIVDLPSLRENRDRCACERAWHRAETFRPTDPVPRRVERSPELLRLTRRLLAAAGQTS